MRLLLLCLFFIFGVFCSIGQENSKDTYYSSLVKNRLEFQMDNDFPFATDRYYTTGSFIGYQRLLRAKNCASCKEQVGIKVQHIFYTPTDRETDDISKFDRPYAGFLGLTGNYTILSGSNLIDFSTVLGVTGKISGAEGFQNLFHSSGGIGRTVLWTDQIANAFHINFNTKFIKDWQLIDAPLGLYIAYSPELALGTKDVYMNQQMVVYFGKRNTMQESSAYNQLGEFSNELFLDVRASYRYVAHNASLQGSLIGDKSAFTLEPESKVIQLGASVYHRRGQNDFKVQVFYETPETKNAEKHMYLSIVYARNF